MAGSSENIVTGAVSRTTLGTSFFSNLVGVAWSAAMVLAVTPILIRSVGIHGYGLIGFSLTIQGLVQVLDLGFAPTINRWLSRFSAGQEEPQHARDIARTLEVGSWTVAIVAGVLVALLASPLSRPWLRVTQLSQGALESSIVLMACMIVAQLPTTYYQSGLLGLQRPLVMNLLKAMAATIGNVGAAVVFVRYSSDVQSYFAVQAAVAVLHALVLRWLFWRTIRHPGQPAGLFRMEVLRSAWRFTATMSLIAICAALFTQIDRVILSRIVPLDDFGHYTLAWVVASGLAVVILPALNTLFPRFSTLVALGDGVAVRSAFHEGAQALSVLLLPLTSVVVFYAFPILDAWTGNPVIARSAAPLALLLTAGMSLNGLMYPVYALQLASGAMRLALTLTVGALVVMVPLVTILAIRNGVTGAAFGWPLLNLIYFIVGSIATFRRLLPGAGREWIVHDIGVPLLAAAGTTLVAQSVLPLPASRPGTIALLGGVLVCSMLVTALATRSTRASILKLVSR